MKISAVNFFKAVHASCIQIVFPTSLALPSITGRPSSPSFTLKGHVDKSAYKAASENLRPIMRFTSYTVLAGFLVAYNWLVAIVHDGGHCGQGWKLYVAVFVGWLVSWLAMPRIVADTCHNSMNSMACLMYTLWAT